MELYRWASELAAFASLLSYLLVFTASRYSRQKTAGLLAGLMVCAAVILWYQRGPWGIAAVAAATAAVEYQISRHRDSRILFLILTCSNYILLGYGFQEFLRLAGISQGICLLCGMAVYFVFLYLLVHLFHLPYLRVQMVSRKEWLMLSLLPVLYYIGLFCFLEASKESGMEELGILRLAVPCCFLLTLYLTYLLAARMLIRVDEEEGAIRESEIMESGLQSLRREMDEVYKTEQRLIAHQFESRQQFLVLLERMEQGNFEGAEKMLGRMAGTDPIAVPSHYCDNAAVDGVVSYYHSMAKDHKITMLIRMDVPKQLEIDEWELAVTIGNLLDNAIRCCGKLLPERERKIWINIHPIHGQLMIEIRNTFQGEIVFDPDTHLPVSERGEGHGIGMRSVAYFAQRTRAIFDCGVEDGIFFARFLL